MGFLIPPNLKNLRFLTQTSAACPSACFQEDESRIRKGCGPENSAAIRHIVLSLIRERKGFKGSVKSKWLNAGMDQEYLEEVILG